MCQTDSPSQRRRERGAAGLVGAPKPPLARPDRCRGDATVARPVIDAGPGVASIVREYAPASLGLDRRLSAASAPSVFASLCPHCEQNARWSAFSCGQWRQGRIAVVSLLYPWYRSAWVMVT